MKKVYITLIISAFLFCSFCERTIDFDNYPIEPRLVLSAVANPDTVLAVKLYKNGSFLENSLIKNDSDYIMKHAKVELTVNNSHREELFFDSLSECYIADYIPVEEDQLILSAVAEGYKSVKAKTSVVNKATYEIVRSILFYKKQDYIDAFTPAVLGASDTVNAITLSLKDPPDVNNYYHLTARCVSYMWMFQAHYFMHDIFVSSDIIFEDKLLDSPIGGWPAFFSNVFDDSLINGQNYNFTIEVRRSEYWHVFSVFEKASACWIEVDLKSISKELYDYYKSIKMYDCAKNDIFSEPIMIYSNVENGAGVFGSLSGNKSIVDTNSVFNEYFTTDGHKIYTN